MLHINDVAMSAEANNTEWNEEITFFQACGGKTKKWDETRAKFGSYLSCDGISLTYGIQRNNLLLQCWIIRTIYPRNKDGSALAQAQIVDVKNQFELI